MEHTQSFVLVAIRALYRHSVSPALPGETMSAEIFRLFLSDKNGHPRRKTTWLTTRNKSLPGEFFLRESMSHSALLLEENTVLQHPPSPVPSLRETLPFAGLCCSSREQKMPPSQSPHCVTGKQRLTKGNLGQPVRVPLCTTAISHQSH